MTDNLTEAIEQLMQQNCPHASPATKGLITAGVVFGVTWASMRSPCETERQLKLFLEKINEHANQKSTGDIRDRAD